MICTWTSSNLLPRQGTPLLLSYDRVSKVLVVFSKISTFSEAKQNQHFTVRYIENVESGRRNTKTPQSVQVIAHRRCAAHASRTGDESCPSSTSRPYRRFEMTASLFWRCNSRKATTVSPSRDSSAPGRATAAATTLLWLIIGMQRKSFRRPRPISTGCSGSGSSVSTARSNHCGSRAGSQSSL